MLPLWFSVSFSSRQKMMQNLAGVSTLQWRLSIDISDLIDLSLCKQLSATKVKNDRIDSRWDRAWDKGPHTDTICKYDIEPINIKSGSMDDRQICKWAKIRPIFGMPWTISRSWYPITIDCRRWEPLRGVASARCFNGKSIQWSIVKQRGERLFSNNAIYSIAHFLPGAQLQLY